MRDITDHVFLYGDPMKIHYTADRRYTFCGRLVSDCVVTKNKNQITCPECDAGYGNLIMDNKIQH